MLTAGCDRFIVIQRLRRCNQVVKILLDSAQLLIVLFEMIEWFLIEILNFFLSISIEPAIIQYCLITLASSIVLSPPLIICLGLESGIFNELKSF